jgi:hypothetical protein
MALLDVILEPPAYGWKDNEGKLVKPTAKEIFKEFFRRLNIFKTRKNWLPFFSWLTLLCLLPFLILLIFKYFSVTLLVAGFFKA